MPGGSPDFAPHIHQVVQKLREHPASLETHVRYCDKLTQDERSLFLTSGGFVGTATSSTTSGDSISLIAGVSMPVVLRQNQGATTYRLLGPAFVQGLMNGEMWKPRAELQQLVIV
jgi:hypothetical protein